MIPERFRQTLANPLSWVALVYLADAIVMLLNRGWYGYEGANIREWIMIVLAMPWILIWERIPSWLGLQKMSQQYCNILVFLVIPFLLNSAVVITIRKIINRSKYAQSAP